MVGKPGRSVPSQCLGRVLNSPEWSLASTATVCLPRTALSFLLIVLGSSCTLTLVLLSYLSHRISSAMLSYPLCPRTPSCLLSPPLLHFVPSSPLACPSTFTVLSVPFHKFPICCLWLFRPCLQEAGLCHPSSLPTALLSQPAGTLSCPVSCPLWPGLFDLPDVRMPPALPIVSLPQTDLLIAPHPLLESLHNGTGCPSLWLPLCYLLCPCLLPATQPVLCPPTPPASAPTVPSAKNTFSLLGSPSTQILSVLG